MSNNQNRTDGDLNGEPDAAEPKRGFWSWLPFSRSKQKKPDPAAQPKATNKPKTKQVIWDWLPGIVAGLMPLGVFFLASMYIQAAGLPDNHPEIVEDLKRDGWVAHLLVLAIVTSTVSTFTAYPRLFMEKEAGTHVGGGSLMFVMVNTLILIAASVLYVIHELHLKEEIAIKTAGIVAALAAFVSLYLEFAISNHQLKNARHPDGEGAHDA